MNHDDGDEGDDLAQRRRAKQMVRIGQIAEAVELCGGFDKVSVDIVNELRRPHRDLTGNDLIIVDSVEQVAALVLGRAAPTSERHCDLEFRRSTGRRVAAILRRDAGQLTDGDRAELRDLGLTDADIDAILASLTPEERDKALVKALATLIEPTLQ